MIEHTREWFNKNKDLMLKNFSIHKCCNCEEIEGLQLHHIVPLSIGGTNFITNLCLVCESCHSFIHDMNLVHNKTLRQKGIEKAKLEGKFKGRKTNLVKGGKEEQRMNDIIKAYLEGMTVNNIRKTYKVGTGTIYRLLEREDIKRIN